MKGSKGQPRLVIDTNVFVSGLISPSGFPAKILKTVRENRAVHLVSDPIVEEYLRVLRYPRIRKFKNVTDTFLAEIATYLAYEAERIELISTITLSPDPDDDVFLATAVDGRANLIISGDRADMLTLGKVRNIPVVTAREAMQQLGSGD